MKMTPPAKRCRTRMDSRFMDKSARAITCRMGIFVHAAYRVFPFLLALSQMMYASESSNCLDGIKCFYNLHVWNGSDGLRFLDLAMSCWMLISNYFLRCTNRDISSKPLDKSNPENWRKRLLSSNQISTSSNCYLLYVKHLLDLVYVLAVVFRVRAMWFTLGVPVLK